MGSVASRSLTYNYLLAGFLASLLVIFFAAYQYFHQTEVREAEDHLMRQRECEAMYEELATAEARFVAAWERNDREGGLKAYEDLSRRYMVHQANLKLWLEKEKPGPLKAQFEERYLEVQQRSTEMSLKDYGLRTSGFVP